MGVDLKGKDLGPNLSQRKKDGKYRARFITASGKRVDRIFDNVKEAKQWLANAKYEDAIKKIDIDLYLELPIQELSKLANRLAQISNELSK